MPSYLVETFLARGAAGERLAREQRARSAAAELTRAGTRVCFEGSIHVPEDEICFFTFEAPTGREAALVAQRAGLEPLRVVEAVPSEGETDMRNRIMVALTAALLGAAAVAGIVLATDAVGVSSRTLATGSLAEVNLNVKTEDWKVQLRTKGMTDVTTVENTVVPGGSFGWHSHPGPSIIIVKSGTITFYHGDDPTCAPDVYHAGQALVDTGNDVHVGRNEGAEDVVVIVTRLIPAGDGPRDSEPASGFCGFDQNP